MRKLTVSLAVIALVGSVASAHAQCAFDGPGKAKGMKSSLIRSFAACPNPTTFPAPNSSTGTGVPTCAPPFAHSDFQFSPKGQCQFQTKAKLESPCSNGGNPCMNLFVKSKCSGIVQSDGSTPIGPGDAGWSITTVTRATLDDPDNGDMTVINFPVVVPFGAPNKGKMQLSTDSNTILSTLGLAALPACTSLEIVSLSIQDPGANPFAKLGAGTRPKGTP